VLGYGTIDAPRSGPPAASGTERPRSTGFALGRAS
jgi:hypothetical protein